MSKNSFTKNFNNCVSGFPIASVAARMLLTEGLIKDIGKVALPVALAAGLYNYGDDAAEWIGNNINKDVGDKLGDWHRAGKEWTQDTWLGQQAGLGGNEAKDRRYYTGQYNKNMAYATNDYNARMAELNNQRVNGDANGHMMTDEEFQKRKAQIDQGFYDRKTRAGQLAYDDTIANAQKNGRSTASWTPDEKSGYFGKNSNASGGDLHKAERDSGLAQHNASYEANKAEGNISRNMTGDGTFIPPAGSPQSGNIGLANGGALHQAERDTGISQQNANYEAQKNQFNASMNRAGQSKSAFLANQTERNISGNMTGDGTYIPPKQPTPAAQPVPAQPAQQTQVPQAQPAPAQQTPQAPAATPDPNAQQTQTLRQPDPALASNGQRVPVAQPAPAGQQPQTPAPQRDVAARPQTPAYIPPAQPVSGQSAADIAKNAVMNAGINAGIQAGIRKLATPAPPKPQIKPLPPGRSALV